MGDPALKLAYPKYKATTTKLNDINISLNPDTIKSLSKIKIDGEIRDENDQIILINGFIFPTV